MTTRPSSALMLSGALALVSALPTDVGAEPVVPYVFLGDSLVDNHNSYIATGLLTPATPVPASPPYYEGRFSNGPNWTDRLAPNQAAWMDYFFSQPGCEDDTSAIGLSSLCGATEDPGRMAGTSLHFAFGGSRAGDEQLPGEAPGMLTALEDLARYRDSGVVADPRGATFVLLTGGNDYTNFLASTANLDDRSIVAETLSRIREGLDRIAGFDAGRAVVLNLFDLSRPPTIVDFFDADALAAARELTAAHNAGLSKMLDAVQTERGLATVYVDLGSLYDDIFANPERYGFRNLTGGCIRGDGSNQPTGLCPDAASTAATLFWDGQHPTTTAHGYIHELVVATLQAVDHDPLRHASLQDSGLLLLRSTQESVRTELDRWRHAGSAVDDARGDTADPSGGRWGFLALDRTRGTRQATRGVSYDHEILSLVGGIWLHPEADPNRLIGAYASLSGLDGDFPGNQSGFEQDALGLGALWAQRWGSWSLSGQVTLLRGDLATRRDTAFSAMPQARATTHGWSIGAELEGRHDQRYTTRLGELGFGSFVRSGARQSRVDGFREFGAEFLDLQVDDTRLSEWTLGAGAEVWLQRQGPGGIWQPRVRLELDRDLLDEARELTGRLPSGQKLNASSRSGSRHQARLTAGLRFLSHSGWTAEGLVSHSRGSGDDRGEILPGLRLSARF